MSLAAREVLSDCRLALEILEREGPPTEWRIHWAGAVALLRTVGHVLRNVDRKEKRYRGAIDGLFLEWKRLKNEGGEHVFFDFIERERNNILKEYAFGAMALNEVPLAIATEDGLEFAEIDGDLYRPVVSGYGEGEDARDIYEEALDWWERQLSVIEAA